MRVVIGVSNGNTGASAAVPRRNSLGDLKIPARISQAQVSLRRDLGSVRDFAASVECKSNIFGPYRLKLHAHKYNACLQSLKISKRHTSSLFRKFKRFSISHQHVPRPLHSFTSPAHILVRAPTPILSHSTSHKQVTRNTIFHGNVPNCSSNLAVALLLPLLDPGLVRVQCPLHRRAFRLP
jgi:hypothetical protein